MARRKKENLPREYKKVNPSEYPMPKSPNPLELSVQSIPERKPTPESYEFVKRSMLAYLYSRRFD